MATIKSVELPTTAGCQHINVLIEHDDRSTETKHYHLSQFTDRTEGWGDPILSQLRNVVPKETVTREAIKLLVENLKIERNGLR